MDNGILSLKDSIELLREENTKGQKETVDKTEETTESVKSLGKTVGELLDEFRGSRKDAEEEKRERARGESGSSGGTKVDKPEKKDDDGLGLLFGAGGVRTILSILVGIPVAIGAFTQGLVVGYTNIFKEIGKSLTRRFDTLRRIANAPANALTRFAQAFKSDVLIKNITRSFENLRNAFRAGLNGVRGLSRNARGTFRQLNLIEKGFRALGATLTTMKMFVTRTVQFFRRVGGTGSNALKLFRKIFSPITKTFRVIVSAIRGFGSRLGGLARLFGALGRFVALPLTIIIGIIDSVKGFIRGFNEQEGIVNKLLGGVLGAISGFLRGFIGVPLDLIKGALAWVLEKFGLENAAEFLRSFSIAEIIGGVFDKLTEFFIGIKDTLLGQIDSDGEGIVDRIKNVLISLVTLPWDLIRQAAAWIAGKLGFEEAEGFLEGFSFFDLFKGMFDRFFGVITSIKDMIFGQIDADGQGIGDRIKNSILTYLTLPYDLIRRAFAWIAGKLGFEQVQGFLEGFSFFDLFKGMVDGFLGLITGIRDFISEKIQVVKDFFADPPGMGELFQMVLNNIYSVLMMPFNLINSAVDTIIGLIGSFIPDDMFASVRNVGGDILSGIKNVLRGLLPDPKGSFTQRRLADLVPDWLYDFVGEAPPPRTETNNIGGNFEDGITETAGPERPSFTQRQLATAQLNVSEQERRDSERASAMVGVSAVDASQRVVNNNVNNNQTALLNPNLPAVDNLDRSWSW